MCGNASDRAVTPMQWKQYICHQSSYEVLVCGKPIVLVSGLAFMLWTLKIERNDKVFNNVQWHAHKL